MAISATIGSAAIGAGGQLIAGQTQNNSARDAATSQEGFYQQGRSDQHPYTEIGASAADALRRLVGAGNDNPLTSPLLKPITMDQATLEQTPGYQFNLAQGLKSVQNNATSRGLGVSGAAQKGAARFATGLADSTYQNQFNNALTNQTNQYNRLMDVARLGQNAAAGVGNSGIATGQNMGNAMMAGGTALAASYTGAANSASQAYPNYLANNLFSGGQPLTGLFGGQDPSSAIASSIASNPSIF